jgi:hypothetical protein
MQAAKTNPVVMSSRSKRYFFPALIIFLLVLLGALYFGFTKATPVSPTRAALSPSALEDKYGLRINLVAITAAGGMIDVRLKVVDSEKAKLLLQDKANFPELSFNKGRVTVSAPEDTKSQVIEFEDHPDVFLLYPNAGNAVKHGTPVSILFGDIAVEPVEVK